jgi:hypothetical protein
MEWLDVSFEEEVVTTAQHDSKRTVDIVLHIIAHDIIKFTTRPNETIKLENPYNIRWQLRVDNLMSSVSIKMTHLYLVTIPYTFILIQTDDRFSAYGTLYQITFDSRYPQLAYLKTLLMSK